jgi:NAD(P)H-dependent FMN reductase
MLNTWFGSKPARSCRHERSVTRGIPRAASPVLEELAQLYRGADGFVIVAGEYNQGIRPGLGNLLDHFLEEYFFRPSAIACYSAGAFGGVRAAMALRMTLAELGMPSIPSILPMPRAGGFGTEWDASRPSLGAAQRSVPRRIRMVRTGSQGRVSSRRSLLT